VNDKQEIQVQLLRLDGKTVMEAAKITGLPEEEIEDIYYRKKHKKSIIGFENTKYLRLDRWMREHGMTRTKFAEKCGIHQSTLASIMNDEVDFGKRSIDKILKTTGLTYEEAFGTEGEIK